MCLKFKFANGKSTGDKRIRELNQTERHLQGNIETLFISSNNLNNLNFPSEFRLPSHGNVPKVSYDT